MGRSRIEAQWSAELAALDASGRRRTLREVNGPQGATVVVDGREVINFSSNDYLGLAGHAALTEALNASDAGTGAGASRLIVGNHTQHRALEVALAAFHDRPAALLFNSGYNANVGILQALAGPDDVIVSDALNHASIIDGCRLSRARVRVYSHADVAAADAILHEHAGARRRLLVTDSVFSMDGDRAPLVELATVAARHGAALILDEAHGAGVLGEGRGLAAELGVRPDVHMGTLGKAFGCFGAYVAGSQTLIDLLLNRARSFVFTTALPPALACAARRALAIVSGAEGAARRARLASNVERFAAGLSARGLLTAGAGTTAIFPVLVGDDRRAMEACEALLAAGIFAQGIRPPTVPEGTARLRFALSAAHEPEHLDAALSALDALGDRLPRA